MASKGSPGRSAQLTEVQPGRRRRLIHRMIVHKGRKGERKGFKEPDFTGLLDAAHQQLGGPIVLIWDNLSGSSSLDRSWALCLQPLLQQATLPLSKPELPRDGEALALVVPD